MRREAKVARGEGRERSRASMEWGSDWQDMGEALEAEGAWTIVDFRLLRCNFADGCNGEVEGLVMLQVVEAIVVVASTATMEAK